MLVLLLGIAAVIGTVVLGTYCGDSWLRFWEGLGDLSQEDQAALQAAGVRASVSTRSRSERTFAAQAGSIRIHPYSIGNKPTQSQELIQEGSDEAQRGNI